MSSLDSASDSRRSPRPRQSAPSWAVLPEDYPPDLSDLDDVGSSPDEPDAFDSTPEAASEAQTSPFYRTIEELKAHLERLGQAGSGGGRHARADAAQPVLLMQERVAELGSQLGQQARESTPPWWQFPDSETRGAAFDGLWVDKDDDAGCAPTARKASKSDAEQDEAHRDWLGGRFDHFDSQISAFAGRLDNFDAQLGAYSAHLGTLSNKASASEQAQTETASQLKSLDSRIASLAKTLGKSVTRVDELPEESARILAEAAEAIAQESAALTAKRLSESFDGAFPTERFAKLEASMDIWLDETRSLSANNAELRAEMRTGFKTLSERLDVLATATDRVAEQAAAGEAEVTAQPIGASEAEEVIAATRAAIGQATGADEEDWETARRGNHYSDRRQSGAVGMWETPWLRMRAEDRDRSTPLIGLLAAAAILLLASFAMLYARLSGDAPGVEHKLNGADYHFEQSHQPAASG